MPAIIRWPPGCRHGGSIRMGPACFKWGDPYTRCLTLEVFGVNVGVIGGLNWRLSREEYRWLEDAFLREGLKPAMERHKPGRESYIVMMAMPKLSKRKPPTKE